MPVDQAERSAKQVDAGGDDRRPHAVVVEDDGLHEIVCVAFVVRRIDDAAGSRRRLDDVEMFDPAIDLAENRIQRMLQRPVERVPLRRLELFEVCEHPLPAVRAAVRTLQVPHDVLACEDGLGEVVIHHEACEL